MRIIPHVGLPSRRWARSYQLRALLLFAVRPIVEGALGEGQLPGALRFARFHTLADSKRVTIATGGLAHETLAAFTHAPPTPSRLARTQSALPPARRPSRWTRHHRKEQNDGVCADVSKKPPAARTARGPKWRKPMNANAAPKVQEPGAMLASYLDAMAAQLPVPAERMLVEPSPDGATAESLGRKPVPVDNALAAAVDADNKRKAP